MRWTDLYNEFVTEQQALVELAAHAWRQAAAAAAGDVGLRSTLAMNQYSPYGICDTLDWRGYPPDELTARWYDSYGASSDHRGLTGATIIRGLG